MIVFTLMTIASTVFVGYSADLHFKAYDMGQKLHVQLLNVNVVKINDYYVSVETSLYIENNASLTLKLSYVNVKLYLNGTSIGEGYVSFSDPLKVEPFTYRVVTVTINNVLASKIINSPRVWFAQILLYAQGIPFIPGGTHLQRRSILMERGE